jgi:hypothetical protein
MVNISNVFQWGLLLRVERWRTRENIIGHSSEVVTNAKSPVFSRAR